MPFSTTFTLTVGSSVNVGPFDIVGQPGSVSVATGVTRATLAAGSLYHNIPDTVTSFDITSTGTCTTSINVLTTPTPTPTETPIGDTIYEFSKCTLEGTLLTLAITSTMITNAGGSLPPAIGDTISLSGSGNVDAVWEFRGVLSADEPSAVNVIGYNIATCTDPQ